MRFVIIIQQTVRVNGCFVIIYIKSALLDEASGSHREAVVTIPPDMKFEVASWNKKVCPLA